MKTLMNLAMISCKQAAELTSKQEFDSLSFGDTLKLKMHQKICKACKQFTQQSKIIDIALDKLLQDKKSKGIVLTTEQKDKILKSLQ